MFASILVDRPLKQSFTYQVPDGMVVAVGQRVVVPFGRQELTGYVVGLQSTFDATGFKVLPLKRVIDKEPVFGSGEIGLSEWMSRFYLCSQGEALALMVPGGKRESIVPAMSMEADDEVGVVRQLTPEQALAIETIGQAEYPMYYLYGVTGSGKSEVFLRSAEHVIAQGRQVIYLVPEITLTFQLAKMVQKRFADRVAILHSALTDSQRLAEWMRIRNGSVDLVIGARSAVFAPVPRLGMIIIDEEHENSYKADQTPRYHARQVAQWRCQGEHALLVMGSATPSMEAWKLAREGKIHFMELLHRVGGGKLPEISVVDMKGVSTTIGPQLEEAMRQVLQRGRQVVLFLNRRGFSYYFHCKSCGYEMTCPHCSVSLTYHKSKNLMVCHYCGYHARPVHVCPQCHSLDVGYSGFGTEMVESEVQALFPGKRVARVDADVSASDSHQNKVRKIIEAFGEGKIDILLGTQMVAKGLNFPGVELVGIVLADSGLNIPDFRAEERTFALLTQVSGRAGRYNDKGRVVIQTFHPENAAIVAAQRGDLKAFYATELANREMTGFPPYSRLVNLVLRGRKEETVVAACATLGDLVRSLDPDGAVEVMCNDACAIERKGDYFRHHILLRSLRPGKLQAVVARALGLFKVPSGIYVEVDIDPMQML